MHSTNQPVIEGIQPVSAYAQTKYSKFKIGLCEIGDTYTCCYACLCPCCAVSQARSALDSSICFFNVCCISPVTERWLIRTAYGIPGSCYRDCVIGLICQPCNANQLLQTTQAYGPLPNAGRTFNRGTFEPGMMKGDVCSCCYAMLCNQCAVATALERGVGMPCCMGLFCSNLFSARNIIRYHYRISGNDLWDECIMPYLVYSLITIGSFFVPYLCCIIAPVIMSMTSNLLNETSLRGSGHQMRYLSGYILTPQELAMVQMGGYAPGRTSIVAAEASVATDPLASIPVVSVQATQAPQAQVMSRGWDNEPTDSNYTNINNNNNITTTSRYGVQQEEGAIRNYSYDNSSKSNTEPQQDAELDSVPVVVVQARKV